MTFEVLMGSYCDHIKKNMILSQFYDTFDAGSLLKLQKELLIAAFVNPRNSERRGLLHRRMTLLHHRLFEMGLNEVHFDMMKYHFMSCLHDYCNDNDAIDSCMANFETLRYIFVENGQGAKRSKHRAFLETAAFRENIRDQQESRRSRSRSVPRPSGARHATRSLSGDRLRADKRTSGRKEAQRSLSGDRLRASPPTTDKVKSRRSGMQRSLSGDKLRATMDKAKSAFGRSHSGDRLRTMDKEGKQRTGVGRSSSGDKLLAMMHRVNKERAKPTRVTVCQ